MICGCFSFSFNFYIFKQEDRVLRQKKNRSVSEQAGINVIFFRCTRKYIFFTIWLVLHSSEGVLHVLLGHSNGEHENTLTKTAKLWILWRINLQGSSHEISGPLTAIQVFFIFFLVLISSPDERNRWHQIQRTGAVITQQHAGFRGGDRRATDWSSTGAIIEQRESRTKGTIKFISIIIYLSIIIIIIIIVITLR